MVKRKVPTRWPRRCAVWAAALATAGAGLAAALPAAMAGASETGSTSRIPLSAYAPMWAATVPDGGSATADLGPADGGAPISARVYLAGRDPAGLTRYATAVSSPGSPLFHRYLTPAQVRARFAPAAGQVTAVTSWLTGAGLHIGAATPQYIAVTGTATHAEQAFGATWDSFSVSGRTQQSPPPAAQLSAPASVAGAVLTVAPVEIGLPGLEAAPSQAVPSRAVPSPAVSPAAGQPSQPAAASATCSQYFGQTLATGLPDAYGKPAPYHVCGYTPQQLRAAYGVPAGLTGQGVTVAVVHPWDVPTAASDLATFGAGHGEPLRPGQFTQLLQPGLEACSPAIQAGNVKFANEEDLDIEAVHAMAPGAGIVYVGTRCDDDLGALAGLDAFTQIVDQHLASIVSNSWAPVRSSPGLIAAYGQVYQQGAAEGIGFYFASGDHGDNSLNSPTHQPTLPNGAGDDPWVTSVGGTTLAVGPQGSYEWETGWGDHATTLTMDGTSWAEPPGPFASGSGGGTSGVFGQPAYQRAVVPAEFSQAHGATPMRVTPDIAADADGATGMLFGKTVSTAPGQPATYQEGPGGGTSASAPLIAGMQADAQQAAGTPIGFANPVIYRLYGASAYHDVTDDPLGPGTELDAVLPIGLGSGQTELDTFGMDLGLSATPGYDNATGVGSPSRHYFALLRPCLRQGLC
jgi:subtilase family serine protease